MSPAVVEVKSTVLPSGTVVLKPTLNIPGPSAAKSTAVPEADKVTYFLSLTSNSCQTAKA